MVSPRPIQLTAIPIAWTPSTNGPVTAPVIVAPIKRERDFDKWRGQLKGKIVMVTLPDNGSEPGEAAFKRYSSDELAKLDQYQQPTYDPAAADRRVQAARFRQEARWVPEERGRGRLRNRIAQRRQAGAW